MKTTLRSVLFSALLPLGCSMSLSAQEEKTMSAEEQAAQQAYESFINSIDWKTNGTGELGDKAEIAVPDGYRFTGNAGTVKLMEFYGNLTNGSELGYFSPSDMSWFAVFEFEDSGYVKDDDKDKLDADAILKQLQEGQLAANSELVRRGFPTLTVTGWQTPPFYNPTTKNLEWAIKLRSSDGSEVVNYKTKILGRRGVMDVVLVASEESLGQVIPEYQSLLKGFAYKPEESYAAFRDGDKIAQYGLTGLIVGGGLLAAAKTGLLAKLWKPIAIGLVAIGAFFKRIFKGKTPESI